MQVGQDSKGGGTYIVRVLQCPAHNHFPPPPPLNHKLTPHTLPLHPRTAPQVDVQDTPLTPSLCPSLYIAG